MDMTLKCVYISFDQTDIDIREKVALSAEEIKKFLLLLKRKNFAEEFFLLSTCNRTELYYVAAYDLKDFFINELRTFKKDPFLREYKKDFSSETDSEKAVKRLFLVSNGVLSTILGDLQIITQVKNAYGLACQAGTAGPHLHRLLQLVFSSHKKVSTHTAIHTGGASVSSVAAEMTLNFVKKNDHSHILIIGAGEFSREVIEQLQKKKKLLKITIMNRSEYNSRRLAIQFGLNILPLDITMDLSGFDVIISCISSSGFWFNRKNLRPETFGQKMFIDLSVPRVFDPSLNTEPNVKLINIDQISENNKLALQKRKDSIPNVLDIIDAFIQEFIAWQHTALARPVLHTFKRAMEEIRLQEVNRHLKKYKNTLDPELIDQVTMSIVNKITKMPAISLTKSSQQNENELTRLSDALIRLFDLKTIETHLLPEM